MIRWLTAIVLTEGPANKARIEICESPLPRPTAFPSDLPFGSQRGTNGGPWKRNISAFGIQWNWALDSTIGKSAGWADGTNTDISIW